MFPSLMPPNTNGGDVVLVKMFSCQGYPIADFKM